MKTLALVTYLLLMFIALCLILVALNTDDWTVINVSEKATGSGLAYLGRTQGVIKECWASKEAVQYVTNDRNRYHSNDRCLHIGIGVLGTYDMRSGLLTGSLICLSIQALLMLIGVIITFVIFIAYTNITSGSEEFKIYLKAALLLALFAGLLGVLGMSFYHASVLVQDDAMTDLNILYPLQFAKDQPDDLIAYTTSAFGYSFWCGWMCTIICWIACFFFVYLFACGRSSDLTCADRQPLKTSPQTVRAFKMVEEEPIARQIPVVQGPPIYDVRDNFGNQFFYDPIRRTKGALIESPRRGGRSIQALPYYNYGLEQYDTAY